MSGDMETWVEWIVRYEVRTAAQVEKRTGEKWEMRESSPLSADRARGLADDLQHSPGANIRNAQLVRKTCEVCEL